MNAIEERPRVKCDGTLIITALERLQKTLDVAANDGGIEAQFAGTGDEFLLADIPAERVEGLFERAARPLLLALRPE